MAASPVRKKARKAWLASHRWLGLVLGAFFVLLGLTGSLLVFYTELDTALNPAVAWQDVTTVLDTRFSLQEGLVEVTDDADRGHSKQRDHPKRYRH